MPHCRRGISNQCIADMKGCHAHPSQQEKTHANIKGSRSQAPPKRSCRGGCSRRRPVPGSGEGATAAAAGVAFTPDAGSLSSGVAQTRMRDCGVLCWPRLGLRGAQGAVGSVEMS